MSAAIAALRLALNREETTYARNEPELKEAEDVVAQMRLELERAESRANLIRGELEGYGANIYSIKSAIVLLEAAEAAEPAMPAIITAKEVQL